MKNCTPVLFAPACPLLIMPSQLACCCCGASSEEHKMLTCSVCKKKYIHSCVDVSSSEIRTIKSKRGLCWTCEACSTMGNDLNDLKAAIVALKDEVSELRKLGASSVSGALSDDQFEEILCEMREREKRRNNLIFYGVVEDLTVPKAERDVADRNVCSNILHHLSIDCEFAPVRLGKGDPSRTSPRPIKLTFGDGQIVHDAIRNVKKLRSRPDCKDVRVSLDRTPRQIRHFKTLKAEMESRASAGEQLKIKYSRGIPKIVPLN